MENEVQTGTGLGYEQKYESALEMIVEKNKEIQSLNYKVDSLKTRQSELIGEIAGLETALDKALDKI